MQTTFFSIAILTAFFGLSTANASPSTKEVVDLHLRTQDLFLKMHGVKYVATALCEEKSGDLVTGLKTISPLIDCIAVRVKRSTDLPAIEAIFSNPLEINGILIHFTDRDPLRNKGGITVHN